MPKQQIDDKKKVKSLLVNSLHQTIEKLGVSKSGKKTEKLLDTSASKIASKVAKQIKKEKKKAEKSKKKAASKKVASKKSAAKKKKA